MASRGAAGPVPALGHAIQVARDTRPTATVMATRARVRVGAGRRPPADVVMWAGPGVTAASSGDIVPGSVASRRRARSAPAANGFRAAATSAGVGYRWAGALASIRPRTAASPGGTSGRAAAIGGGG